MVKKITNNKFIKLYLDNYGRKYYLRELSSLLKKSHQTIKPHLETLVKDGIMVKTERKNIIEYGLNMKDNRVYEYLIIAEKERMMERLKEDTTFGVLFERLSNFFRNNTFIVFGSSVDAIRKESDIDILVIGRDRLSKTLEEFENIYNKKIHKIQVSDIEKLTPTLINEIYKKHIILNNTEYVIRFFGDLYGQNKLV